MKSSLRERLPPVRSLIPPLLVTAGVIVSWAWFASMAMPAGLAAVLAAVTGLCLLASWLTVARRPAATGTGTKANENLLTQLGQEGRGGRRLGIYDSASGLFNRAYLELRLQEEFLRCSRYNISLSLVNIRVGDVGLTLFSNDTWASLAADVGKTMANTVRAVDITAALAPLDFAICLMHCDREGAERAIDRLAGELEGQPIEVGLAVYPDDSFDPAAFIELARGRASGLASAKQIA